jgi:hypothetical protein
MVYAPVVGDEPDHVDQYFGNAGFLTEIVVQRTSLNGTARDEDRGNERGDEQHGDRFASVHVRHILQNPYLA